MSTRQSPIIARLVAAGALACASASASTVLGACASTEDPSGADPEVTEKVAPGDGGAPDGDAASDGEAGACTSDDCEYFPVDCAPDILCPNGPFDPTNPSAGLDWRTRINAIAGRSPSDVWIAGAVGSIAHFDGASWTMSELGTEETQHVLWLPESGEVTLGTLRRIYTRGLPAGDGGPASGGGWSERPISPPSGYGALLRSAWAPPGSNTLWLGTNDDLWRLRRTEASEFESLPGISGSICSSIQCGRMRGIHGASASTLWAVGEVGRTVRITGADGETPSASPLNARTWVGLSGVWAASDTDVWAVGGTGTIRHYTGDALRWEIVPDVPTNEDLNAVWGTSSKDVWTVGNKGVVLHYDGNGWTRVKVAGLGARRPDLHSVWSPGPGHLWIGGHGVVLALGGKP